MMTATSCLFCDKLNQLTPWPESDIVWNFPNSIAILGQWQFYTGYCVLISRIHATELHELRERKSIYLEEMSILAESICLEFQPRKLNYELLGNQVPHLHWHLFPREQNDPDHLSPVWLKLDRAAKDPVIQVQMETGSCSRSETIERLSKRLTALNAQTDQQRAMA